jgi:UDP:flavonoid glycosyltransferase YjiC (YdhE family)
MPMRLLFPRNARCGCLESVRVLVVTWGPGGNLPPMLAAARVLAGRGHHVTVLGSRETRGEAERLGFPVLGYRRTPDPDTSVAFESQAGRLMAIAAGADVALDCRDAIDDARPDLAVVDCMLPAALAASRAAGTSAASIVHFLYGAARRRMLEHGGGWTTDLDTLAGTHRTLGLVPARNGLAAWEAPDLVLVTAPRWLDVDAGAPSHVVHAGPLAVRVGGGAERSRVLLTFSTTVMAGQPALIERACAAVAGLGVRPTLTLGPAVDREAVHLPGDVEVLAFADHDGLLPECAAVVSHGGLGTVLRALAHGVPLLVLPLGRDQAVNADRVERLGAGLALPADASPERLRSAMRALLGDASFRAAARAAAERIAPAEPDRTAAEALERAARLRPRTPSPSRPSSG